MHTQQCIHSNAYTMYLCRIKIDMISGLSYKSTRLSMRLKVACVLTEMKSHGSLFQSLMTLGKKKWRCAKVFIFGPYSAILWWNLGDGWGWGVKTEAGMIDPPKRIRLHNSSFCFLRRAAREDQFSWLTGSWLEDQRPVASLAANFCVASSLLL